MSMAERDRQQTARQCGAFWLPCPSCGQMFSGLEVIAVNGHDYSLPFPGDPQRGQMICVHCTALGVACKARAALGLHSYQPAHECQYAAVAAP